MPPTDDDEDATPYGLAKGDAVRTGVSAEMGRIRISNDPGPVRSLAIADREPIALASIDERVIVLNLLKKERVGSLKGHDARVTCGAISPDGHTGITGDREGHILVWDAAEREMRWRYKLHDGPVNSVGLSPCGRYVVSGGEDGEVRLWRVKNGKEFDLIKARWNAPVRTVAFAPDGKHILAGGHKLVMWDFDTGDVTHRLDALPGGFGAVTFSADGKHISASGARQVRVFRWERDTATPDLMLAVPPSEERQIYSASLSLGGEHLVTLADVVTAGPVRGKGIGAVGMGVTFLAFGIVGAIVLDQVVQASTAKGATRTLTVEVWKIGNKERGSFFPIDLPKGRVSILASSNQRRLMVGAADGYVRLFAFL